MLLNVSIFHAFLLINSIPLYKYTTVWPYKYSRVLAITNKSDMNICVQVFMWTSALFSFV